MVRKHQEGSIGRDRWRASIVHISKPLAGLLSVSNSFTPALPLLSKHVDLQAQNQSVYYTFVSLSSRF
jgi:hypothetical protein